MHVTWPTSITQPYKLNYSSNFNFEDLFPASSTFPSSSNMFPWGNTNTDLLSILQTVQESFVSYDLVSVRGEARPNNDYLKYLAANDDKIKELAEAIVDPGDSDDEKMYKIEQWVINNLEYVLDSVNYGKEEYWTTPRETLRKMKGDCEDGAFLIHSLGLNAGVDPDRLRTYGGVVAWQNEAGGLSAGGHGWTSYKKSDGEWVILDWCFFQTDKPFSERISMTEDQKYVDDYFFVNLKNTVDTPLSNGIRTPDEHVGYADSRKKINPYGNFINFLV